MAQSCGDIFKYYMKLFRNQIEEKQTTVTSQFCKHYFPLLCPHLPLFLSLSLSLSFCYPSFLIHPFTTSSAERHSPALNHAYIHPHDVKMKVRDG